MGNEIPSIEPPLHEVRRDLISTPSILRGVTAKSQAEGRSRSARKAVMLDRTAMP